MCIRDRACTYRIEAHPEKVELKWEEGTVTLAYADSDTLLISGRGKGAGIRLDFLPGEAFDFIQPVLSGKDLSLIHISAERDIMIAEVGVWNSPHHPDPEQAALAREACLEQLRLAEYIGAE